MWIINILVGVEFFPTLESGSLVKIYFTLGSATVSDSGTCGGSVLSVIMVSAIVNGSFLFGCLTYNKNCCSGRWRTEECDDIICCLFLNPPTLLLGKGILGVRNRLCHTSLPGLFLRNNTVHTNNASLGVPHTSRLLCSSPKLNFVLVSNGSLPLYLEVL